MRRCLLTRLSQPPILIVFPVLSIIVIAFIVRLIVSTSTLADPSAPLIVGLICAICTVVGFAVEVDAVGRRVGIFSSVRGELLLLRLIVGIRVGVDLLRPLFRVTEVRRGPDLAYNIYTTIGLIINSV